RIIKSRFLGYGSFWLSHKLADLLGFVFPWEVTIYYRIPNVLIHILAATAVFWLARELTQRRLTAGIAGALFLLHPIQTQAVTYISQRFESQAAMFMFLAAAAYVRFRRTRLKAWLAPALVFAAAAATTKETAVVLPLWLLVIEFTFFDRSRIRRSALYVLPVGLILLYPAWNAFQSSGTLTLGWIPYHQYLLTQGPIL